MFEDTFTHDDIRILTDALKGYVINVEDGLENDFDRFEGYIEDRDKAVLMVNLLELKTMSND